MRIAILTSSRADFGIYLPLLRKLKSDNTFKLDIIAFGTHLSPFHGETINQIKEQGFDVKYKIESMLLTDSPEAISTAIGLTMIKFASFWNEYSREFDLVFCLGDRYEMFAAVTAAIPYNVKFAHLHGGETTLGAIDNIFRHGISLASQYHFVSTRQYAARVASLIESSENIYYIGALSLDNLSDLDILSIDEFKKKWQIDLSKKTILTTFHPETVNSGENENYSNQLVKFIQNNPEYQFLITMPNADTCGNLVRKILKTELSSYNTVYMIENLGSQSYFSAMKHCSFLLGNTSSGIIEAASFNKFVINLGDRQKGRACGENVITVPIDSHQMQIALEKVEHSGIYLGVNIYYKNNSSDQIIEILKNVRNAR